MTSLIYRVPPLRYLLIAALLAVAALAGYGYSIARSAPAPPGVVLLCVSHWTGQVRHVTDTTKCTSGYVLEVNQQGTQGPQGPAGPPGPQGIQGQPGVSGYEIVEVTENGDGNTSVPTMQLDVPCPNGKSAVGGGVSPGFTSLIGWSVLRSYPLANGSGWGGIVGNINVSTPIGTITVWAICATV